MSLFARIALALAAIALIASSFAAFPVAASAAVPEDDFEISGWIPYWEVSAGTRAARKNIDLLTEIHPFTFSVSTDGKLKDLGKMSSGNWKRLISTAKAHEVRVVPTVMWSDTATIHKILSDTKLRAKHVKAVADMVKKGKYDGVDIDYEGKRAETRPYFSLFLKELDAALGDKFLTCTIEARTPPESLYTTIPAKLEYANDYDEINKYCDRVTIMAYDQQRADLKLNSSRAGEPYYPVADLAWVKKVAELAAKSIDKDKLTLGVATYGRETEVTVSPNWYQNYTQLWSVSDEYARDNADEYHIKPSRNKAGELSYSYIPESSNLKIPSSIKAPAGTSSGNMAAARALAYANKTGQTVKVNLVWWSDAEAIKQKVELAKDLGLRGITIFKIDGNEDEDLWNVL